LYAGHSGTPESLHLLNIPEANATLHEIAEQFRLLPLYV